MFKRDNEQPVKVSFEEKNEKRTRRSLRERLSNIPLRRRVEAVLLAVVTVMASLSIDWSSLLARAAEEDYILDGQSISTVFIPQGVGATTITTLSKAKISVEVASTEKEVDYTYKVYQNLKSTGNPESGVEVKVAAEGKTQSGTIKYDADNSSHFEDLEIELPNVVLLGDEAAAVVFTLESKDGKNITFKTFDNSGVHYVKNDINWNLNPSGTCIQYTSATSETSESLTKVTLSGVPQKIALTTGQSYTFSGINWSPGYQRKLTLKKSETDLIQNNLTYPTFTVTSDATKSGNATITVGGTGVTDSDPVTVKVVSFEMKGTEADKSIFTYTGKEFTAEDLYEAKCGNDDIDLTEDFVTSIFQDDITATPKNAGAYTMIVEGAEGGDYDGLTFTKEFSIEPTALVHDTMFANAKVTVEGGEIKNITGAKFGNIGLKYRTDFTAEITQTIPGTDKVDYKITVSGKGNYKGDVTLEAAEAGDLKFESVVDHVRFKSTVGTYDAKEQYPEIVFCDSNDQEIKVDDKSVFVKDTNYYVTYSGTVRGSGAEINEAENIVDAGEYTATVHGMDKYLGSSMTTSNSYVLRPIGLNTSNTVVKLKQEYYESDASLAINPEIDSVTYTVSNTEKIRLSVGRDYELKSDEYARDVGSHNVTISGIGNYDGEASTKYHVFASLLNSTSVELTTTELGSVTDGNMRAEKTSDWDYVWSHNKAFTYTGEAIKPTFRVRVNDDVLSVGSGDGYMSASAGKYNTGVTKDGNKAYFILTLPAKYASKKIKVEFEIAAKPLPEGALVFGGGEISKNYAYGSPIELNEGTEYSVEDGDLPLEEDVDYTISYKDNVNAGMATITATGIGNYSGTSSKDFKILPVKVANNSKLTIEIKPQKLNTSGTEVTNMDDVVVGIKNSYGRMIYPFTSDDFTLSGYDHNTKAWIAGDTSDQPEVLFTGKNNLVGSRVVKFEILKETLTGLKWELSDNPSVYGYLGSPESTVDLTAQFGYELDYAPKLPAKYIKLSYSDGSKFDGGNYTSICQSPLKAGQNTITISGKENYEGGKYYFTFNVNSVDISSDKCSYEQSESTDGKLPTFSLSINGELLKKGVDYNETVDPSPNGDGTYPARDGYKVTFTGIEPAYTGTRTETFHVGKEFDSKNVFITMYGPTGTKTVNGENRLTYFGNNDPYFILTSDKTDSSNKIEGPTYARGDYDPDTGDYNITFEPSDPAERHKVGTTVKVTFTAKEGNGVWYNPGDEGITYYYKVMPGVGASVTGYPNLQTRLSIFTAYSDSKPQEGAKKPFPETVTNNLIPFSGFEFPYTTEEIDPEIYIRYDPVIDSGGRATQCSSGGVPSAPTGEGLYAAPIKVKFNDSSLFTVSKGLISANDTEKKILMSPVSTGWLAASNNPPKIEVNYSFTAAKLSDAKITFTPSNEYTYSGKAAAIDYKVTIGNTGSTVLKAGTDYEVQGYYAIPDSGDAKSAIDNAITSPSTIEDGTLASFGNSLGTTPPTDAGNYALVIKEGNGGNYKGYNIAKFSIKSAGFTAAFAKSDFSVLYGSDKLVPKAEDLIVTGVNGEELLCGGENGYTIEVEEGSNQKPTNAAVVNIKGKGNYKDASKQLTYPVFADISKTTPDFSVTNLSLDEHTGSDNCLGLTLENDGEHPYIYGTNTKFDLSTLNLSEKNGSAKIEASDLTTTVTAVGNYRGDSLETVGMKKITVSGKTGSPVRGSRTYYVEVFADISTADITLEANGTLVSGGVIPYTGQAITVNPILKFRGTVLDRNSYTVTNEEGRSFTAVGKHMMTLKGNHDTAGDEKYYIGTPTINFSIAYDLQNGVEIVYAKAENSTTTYVPLSGMSFGYTGNPIGTTIEEKIVVRLKNNKDVILNKGQDQDYTLEFANDTLPGGNTAKATINHTSINSINEQTVYFSIGGNKLTEDNCKITFTDTDPEKLVYDGTAKEPAVTVTYTDEKNQSRVLSKDTDYKITYSRNIDVPPADATDSQKPSVTVTGIGGRYEGSVTKTFNITPKKIEESDVDFPNVPFGGRDSNKNLLPSTPSITVTSGGRTLVAGTDYEITYVGKQTDETVDQYFTKPAGSQYTIKIKGIGNYYTGPDGIQKQATQLSGTLNNNPNIIIDPSQAMTSVYNGKKVTFGGTGPKIMNGKSTLREGTDYSIEIPEIINAGTYDIKIKALPKGDYYDNGSSKTFTYTVTPRSVEENEGAFVLTLYDPTTGNSGTSFKWTGNKIQTLVKLVDTGITGRDSSVGEIWTDVDSLKQSIMMDSFTVTYGDNRFAGKDAGSVILNASGNYTGSITRTFSIGTDIANATLSYDKTSAEYDGTPKKQDITVRYNNNTLEAGVAYESPITYTYTDSKGNVQETTSPSAVGTYVPVIKGKTDGGYYGELKGSPFRIIAQNKTGNIRIKFNGIGGKVDAADYVCHYNTKKQEPSISVYDTSGGTDVALTENVDYKVSYGNNTNAGSGYVYVALQGNYTGTAQEIFTIQPYDISNATLEFIEGENGIIKNVPEASFPYSPLFKLIGTDDDGKNFEISYADSRQKQDLSIPDSSKVKKPGKGSLIVSGTGNNLYGTTNAYDYEVYGRLSEKNVIVTPPINTGVKKDPEVKVVFAGETLVLDTDYSLRIVPFDQTVSGGGNVIVEGLGYFTGSVYTKYGEASDVSSLTLRGFSQQYIYSGVFAGPQESAIYAVDKDGNTVISADKLECTFTSDKDNAACITANATVTITTKATLEDGTVQDGPKATYKIVPRNINSCDIMRLENDIYTGKALKPPVAVSFRRKEYTFGSTGGIAEEKVLDVITLKEGTDYSLSYKNNVYPGTADITVTGKGNYTGTRLFHFVINVISMGSVNARRTSDGIVVSWGARPYVAGYRVLYDTEKLTAVSTTGTTVTLKDALPTRVGVQAYILGSDKKPIYGAPKYIDVS